MNNNSFTLITLATLLLVSCDTGFNKTKQCNITPVNGTDAYWAEYLGHDQTMDFWPGGGRLTVDETGGRTPGFPAWPGGLDLPATRRK